MSQKAIREEVAKINKNLAKLERQHHEEKRPLQKRLEALQAKCDHKNRDVCFMGGSEYSATCKDCGAEL